MPYRITATYNQRKYVSIVPRKQLAYQIIKHLKALNFDLAAIKQLLSHAEYHSRIRLLSEDEFFELTEHHPELDWIYRSITLNNNQRLYFHTNWDMPKAHWFKLSEALAARNIYIETLPGPDYHDHHIYDVETQA